MKKALLALILVLSFSCNSKDDNDIVCTDEFVFGLSVTVLDSVTQEPIVLAITVTATDEDYSEELMLNNNKFFGARERSGEYMITVVAVGYQSEVSEVITVDANTCPVITSVVELQLTPN